MTCKGLRQASVIHPGSGLRASFDYEPPRQGEKDSYVKGREELPLNSPASEKWFKHKKMNEKWERLVKSNGEQA